MIITKTALPRRTFLRGLGATVALPLLDAMVPALSAISKTAAAPVKRLGFIYLPNGAVLQTWTPRGAGSDLKLSPTLSPLSPFHDQTLVYTRLAHGQAEPLGDGNGEHSRASSVWLNGVHPKHTEGADVRGRRHRRPGGRGQHRRRHAAAFPGAGHRPRLPGRQLRERL